MNTVSTSSHAKNRFGGRLSVRGAMELVQHEQEQARLDKLDEKQV